jgi:hypothetical protein
VCAHYTLSREAQNLLRLTRFRGAAMLTAD